MDAVADSPNSPASLVPTPRPVKLLEQLRRQVRAGHYSLRTEQAYVDWSRRFILYVYKQVLGIDLPWLDEVVQAKASRRLPVVLTHRELRGMLHPLGVIGERWLQRPLGGHQKLSKE